MIIILPFTAIVSKERTHAIKIIIIIVIITCTHFTYTHTYVLYISYYDDVCVCVCVCAQLHEFGAHRMAGRKEANRFFICFNDIRAIIIIKTMYDGYYIVIMIIELRCLGGITIFC